MVLVFIVTITQAAIRSGRGHATVEDTLTMVEFRAALSAVRDVETALQRSPAPTMPTPPDNVQPFKASGDE